MKKSTVSGILIIFFGMGTINLQATDPHSPEKEDFGCIQLQKIPTVSDVVNEILKADQKAAWSWHHYLAELQKKRGYRAHPSKEWCDAYWALLLFEHHAIVTEDPVLILTIAQKCKTNVCREFLQKLHGTAQEKYKSHEQFKKTPPSLS